MSEIDRSHLLALDARLKTLPKVWGKCREDRQGGLTAVFDRGEKLADEWRRDPIAAEQNSVPKVGLSSSTYNRHINTLKQILGFARDLEDGKGKQTHLAPEVSFHKLRQKDKRKKNKRKPVPAEQELRTLLSGPLFTGCKRRRKSLHPGHRGYSRRRLLGTAISRHVTDPGRTRFCQMPLGQHR